MRQREQREHDGERRHRPTPDFHKNDAGGFEILLHKALLNPVHHLVVEDLLHKTLQDPVLGENQDLLRDASRLPTAPPALTIREPTLGLLGAAPDKDVVDRSVVLYGLGSPRGRGSPFPEGRRRSTDKSSGQQLRRECYPSLGSSRCPCRHPGWLLAS